MITLHGHGVYCYVCQEVYSSTDECEHGHDRKDGVRKTPDGYVTDPADMGHYSPHQYIEVDGLEKCAECGQTKIPAGWVEE